MSEHQFTLSANHPLALLPAQLQARYTKETLRVRVIPDLIHGANHDVELTAAEIAAGTAYWTDLRADPEDAQIVQLARETLASRVGPFRALWVAKQCQPINWDDVESVEALVFPKREPIDAHAPMAARLLPDHWLLRAYDSDGNEVHRTISKPVDQTLRLAPSLGTVEDVDDADHVLAFLKRQKLDWTVSFKTAVEVGMAFEIARADLPHHIGALLVCGVRENRKAVLEAAELETQLRDHWYRRGVDFLPQGTPTNNSDGGRTGFSVRAPDLEALFTAEARRRPLAPLGRGVLINRLPEALYQLPAADTAALALGLVGQSVLDRGEFADMAEGLGAWAMNMAVGFATLGRYGSEILSQTDGKSAASAFLSDLREHYSAWVRAGAHVPVLRIGPQPYGILPVCDPPPVYFGYSEDFKQKYDHYMSQLIERFSGRIEASTLDPNATDGSPGDTPRESTLALLEVLGAVPHPTNLHLRTLTDHIDEDRDTFEDIITALDEAAHLDQAPIMEQPPGNFIFFSHDYWEPRKTTLTGIPSPDQPQASVLDIAAQWVQVEMLVSEVERHAPSHIRGLMLDIIDNRLTPLFQVYLDAYRAVPDLWAELFESGGLSGGEPPAVRHQHIPRLVGSTFAEEATPAGDLVSRSGDLEPLAILLDQVIDALEKPEKPRNRKSLVHDASPLLCHLINDAYLRVPEKMAETVRNALILLRARLNAGVEEGADLDAEFGWLLRGSLSLVMSRIDAWILSRAAEKLARLRQQRATGIAIGGYGWLLDLRESKDPQSQGFIHAGSMTQAVAAGVLRSGWSAYGADSATAPLSVNLSSRRVRQGRWIIDALRNGQDLAEVLGAMFERALHERHLDAWIDDLRGAVNPIAGIEPARQQLIDGLLVARSGFDDATPQEQSAGQAIDAVLTNASTAEADGVREAAAEVMDALDSVGDLALTQAVYALVRGDVDGAGAALSLTGGGDATIPPIDVVETHREAQLVNHRVALAVGLRITNGDEPLDVAEPSLHYWLKQRLGNAKQVHAQVRVLDPKGATLRSSTIALADCGLDVPAAAVLARHSASQEGGRLARAVAAYAKHRFGKSGEIEVDLADPGHSGTSIDAFGLLAAPLVRALTQGRAMTPEDLLPPGAETTAEDTVDDAALEARATRLAEVLETLSAIITDEEPHAVVPAAIQVAGLGLPGGLLVAENPEDQTQRDRLAEALTNRIAQLGEKDVDAAQRLTTAIGGALPILPPVYSSQRDELRKSLGQHRSAISDHAESWWRKVTNVRSNLSEYAMHCLLLESHRNHNALAPAVCQLPAYGNESWAAVERPVHDGRDRVSLFLVDGAPGFRGSGPLSGVMLDGWTEGIPAAQQQTGITWHFDTPSARPPQSILLATTDQDQFDADVVFAQIQQVITLMKMRAVGPDRLRMLPAPNRPQDESDPDYIEPAIGQYLPGTYLEEHAKVSGEEV